MQSTIVAVGRPVGFTEGFDDILVEDVVLSVQLLQDFRRWKLYGKTELHESICLTVSQVYAILRSNTDNTEGSPSGVIDVDICNEGRSTWTQVE